MALTALGHSDSVFNFSNTSLEYNRIEKIEHENVLEDAEDSHQTFSISSIKTWGSDLSDSSDNNITICKEIFCNSFAHEWSRSNPNLLYLLLYNLIGPLFVIGVGSTIAYFVQLPFMFPSLGPTAFLHFAVPSAPPASPRNTLIGHIVGIVMAIIALLITGLFGAPPIWVAGFDIARIICSALSVALTCFVMILLQVEHPPAAATTLIVSLGILNTPIQWACMVGAVLLITILAFCINRLFRKDVIYPLWNQKFKCYKPPNKRKTMRKHQSHRFGRGGNLGYDTMQIKTMNGEKLKVKQLEMLKYEDLDSDNFGEYYDIAAKLRKEKYMKILIKFAVNHPYKQQVMERIPYIAQIMITMVDTLKTTIKATNDSEQT
eukprot:362250_1